ncbi:hypothetical protein L249_5160 [Ophiocordyceps polyrhachis-furcata BCC 54312]|uniref:Uncharacterized protein n=1 Tax=Ophiocordyceps polyrhachis-furcata BCC 54312 TaxID=1330021 RepID=A0A367L9M9_9HYPO|nr:hypothetical protein L249_5160 [Ophiocordyceps polyrhachis-furcata BCC 54312]
MSVCASITRHKVGYITFILMILVPDKWLLPGTLIEKRSAVARILPPIPCPASSIVDHLRCSQQIVAVSMSLLHENVDVATEEGMSLFTGLGPSFLTNSILISTCLAYPPSNSPKPDCDSTFNLTALSFDFEGNFYRFQFWSPYPRYYIYQAGEIKWRWHNITFALVNPALDYEANCSSLALLEPGKYYPCSGLPLGHSADFSFDLNLYKLRVRYHWTCPNTSTVHRVKARIGMNCIKAEAVGKPSHGWVKCEQVNSTTLPTEAWG